MVILCGLAKAIHSLTGLNILMVCLIFHTAFIINQKNWKITIKLHFENLSIFFQKSTRTPLPPFVFFPFSMTPPPPPPSSPQRMYFLNNPFWNLCSWQSNSSGENETALSLLHKWFGSYWEHLLLRQCNKDHLDFCKNNPKL